MKILYTSEVTARGGRTGTARSSDGALDVTLVKPREMGGPGEGGTNPEQLFAAGYAACFLSTMEFLAGQKKLALGEVEITARVGVGPRETAPGYGLRVEMTVRAPDLTGEAAQALADEAHLNCPYSNATRGNIEVAIRVAGAGNPPE